MRQAIFVGMTALAMLAAVPATAKEISIKNNSESELKGKCAGKGSFVPSTGGGAYACVGDNGSVIACGGKTKQQKKTCTVTEHFTGNDPTHRPDIGGLPLAPAQRP